MDCAQDHGEERCGCEGVRGVMGIDINHITIDGSRRSMSLHWSLNLPFVSSLFSYKAGTIKQIHVPHTSPCSGDQGWWIPVAVTTRI